LEIIFLLAVLLSVSGGNETALSGYEANIRTVVYEDGSLSRTIELSLNPDNKESTKWKKDFLTKNGYRTEEKNSDDNFYLVAAKVYTPSKNNGMHFDDELSRISLQKQNDEFLYREEFLTAFVMNEVNASDLRNDKPAAKVLLADTQYNFYTTMPGKIEGISSGEYNKNIAHWNFDIEQLFNHPTLEMATTSSTAREENVNWLILFTGVLLLLISALLAMKNRNPQITQLNH
jgi:hypothetical protein